jgi:hypothetical protein
MHFRPAPLQFVLAIKRRLEQTNPGARLDEKSVRLVGVPMTQFDATIFLFEQNGKTKLVAELARPDLRRQNASAGCEQARHGSGAGLVHHPYRLPHSARLALQPRKHHPRQRFLPGLISK